MREVVLDETVYVKALRAECTRSSEDLLAAELVQHVQAQHRWVVTGRIFRAYKRQFSWCKCKGLVTSALMKSLDQVLQHSSRSRLLTPEPPDVEGDYHLKDRHVVSAAAAVQGSVLITDDVRLIEALTAEEIPRRYRFDVVQHGEALLHLLVSAESAES
jgi:hypothetical protein